MWVCSPVRSLLSMRLRSASTQNSFPSLLSSARDTGRIRPVVNRDSRSVPSRDAPSILAERSCMVVKYMYLQGGRQREGGGGGGGGGDRGREGWREGWREGGRVRKQNRKH